MGWRDAEAIGQMLVSGYPRVDPFGMRKWRLIAHCSHLAELTPPREGFPLIDLSSDPTDEEVARVLTSWRTAYENAWRDSTFENFSRTCGGQGCRIGEATGLGMRKFAHHTPDIPKPGPSDNAVLFALRCLGLSAEATTADIRARWRSLVKELHPDRNAGEEDAANKLSLVNSAKDLLEERYGSL